MSDNDEFPGFADDAPKPAPKPAAKPTAPGAGFDPFADAGTAPAKPAAPAARPAAPAARSAPPAAKPAAPAARPAAGFDPFAGVKVDPNAAPPAAAAATPSLAQAQADEDAEVRPGQGKDLWACPHCGAKNKPTRDTCRACGKSPSEAVVVPWHQPLPVRIALGVVAAGVLIGLIVLLFSGGPPRLVPAEADSIDAKPRTDEPAGGPGDLAGTAFTPTRTFAICGRVIESKALSDGVTAIILALGDQARDPASVNDIAVDLKPTPPTADTTIPTLVVYAFGDFTVPPRGGVFSLIGDAGTVEDMAKYEGGTLLRVRDSAPR